MLYEVITKLLFVSRANPKLEESFAREFNVPNNLKLRKMDSENAK